MPTNKVVRHWRVCLLFLLLVLRFYFGLFSLASVVVGSPVYFLFRLLCRFLIGLVVFPWSVPINESEYCFITFGRIFDKLVFVNLWPIDGSLFNENILIP